MLGDSHLCRHAEVMRGKFQSPTPKLCLGFRRRAERVTLNAVIVSVLRIDQTGVSIVAATPDFTSSTYTASDTGQLERVYDMLTVDEAHAPAGRYYLAGSVEDDAVELPEELYQLLCHVVRAMRTGLSVTISPTSQTLTTQQAADLLGISRPTLIKALDSGKLPYTRSGSHRRIALADVLEYRETRRQEQYAAIDALSVDIDETTDIDQTLADLRAARKAVARQRRSNRAS